MRFMTGSVIFPRGHYVTTGSSDAGASSSLAGGDYNVSQGSSVPGTGEIFCNYFTWNSGGDGNPFDASGGNDGGDDNGTPKTEDLEIRMDLTDDLLHMVPSFIQSMIFPLSLFCIDYVVLFLTPAFLPRFFLSWTTLIFVELLLFVGSGEQLVLMRIFGDV